MLTARAAAGINWDEGKRLLRCGDPADGIRKIILDVCKMSKVPEEASGHLMPALSFGRLASQNAKETEKTIES